MTQDEFMFLLKKPETVTANHVSDLKEMTTHYPYFSEAKMLLAKAMLKSSNLHAGHYIDHTAIAVPDRRVFYYLLYPEKKLSNEPIKTERIPKFGGNYFDMLQVMETEGGDTKQSLKNLAERLKSARAMISKDPKKTVEPIIPQQVQVRIPTPEYFNLNEVVTPKTAWVSEDNVKKLIKEKKYREAIEILNKLNLINPKKSIYFADQIRFLEKILVNSKK
jgi:hypothetical protein